MSIPSEESREEPRTSEDHRLHDGHPSDRRRRDRARLQEARSDRGGGKRHPQLRRHQRRRRRVPRDPAAQDHGADRPQRRRQDHAVQPAHRIRHPELGQVAVRRQQPRRASPPTRWPGWAWCAPSSSPRSWASSPSWRTCGWAPRTSPASGSSKALFKGIWGGQEKKITERGQRAAGEVQARRQEGRLRGVALRRPAQAAGNGPLPDGPARSSSCSTSRWPASTRR